MTTMHTLDDIRGAVTGGRHLTGVGVSARIELAAHALNNEGSRNNATMPRQVDVVAGDDIIQVNAISGDTIKHAFVDYLKAAIADRPSANDALPICAACGANDPNRLNAVKEFQKLAERDVKAVGNEDIIREMIRRCTVDDIAGLLVTLGKRNAPRRSAVQFGWQLGVPEQVRTGRYTHVKLVPADPAGGDGGDGSNLGQNIFTKPASSGVYAFVGQLELQRIGRNDITLLREIDDAAWRERAAAALTAMFHTIALPGGAQRNTQLPHVHGAEGALAVSVAALPPVIYSPLAADFVEQMTRIAAAFGRAGTDHFVVPFADLGELGAILGGLSDLVLGG